MPPPVPPPAQQDVDPDVDLDVEVVVLPHGLGLPERAHPGDAGLDLCATADLDLAPGERALVGTGIALALPAGHVGLVHPRSGLAARTGLTVLNAPGTIDAGYRGEVAVCLVNHDAEHVVHVRRGDRVAQLVVQRVARVALRAVDRLPGSVRGASGHGSSGGSAHLDHPSRDADHTDHRVQGTTAVGTVHEPDQDEQIERDEES